MTVGGFWSWLNKHHAAVFKDMRDPASHAGERWGIDTSIYMHRLGGDMPTPPLMEFMEQIDEMRALKIVPVYIFDGKRDPVKRHEHERRRETTQRMVDQSHKRGEWLAKIDEIHEPITEQHLLDLASTTGAPPDVRRVVETMAVAEITGMGGFTIELNPERVVNQIRERHERETMLRAKGGRVIPEGHYHALMHMLDEENIGYYIAKTDAEKLGAQLLRDNKIDVLVTDDGDALAFGAKRILRNMFSQGKSGNLFVDVADVLSATELTQEQLVDVCVMCGCDYTDARGIPLIGPVKAVKLIKKHGSLEQYLDSLDWQSHQATIARSKRCEFDMQRFQWQDARATFLDREDQVRYASKAIDPMAEPIPVRVRAPSVEPVGTDDVESGLSVYVGGVSYPSSQPKQKRTNPSPIVF